MILATDVHYKDGRAAAAALLFKNWDDPSPASTMIKEIASVAPYVPGQFYKRELPCIQALLLDVTERLETIIIDGYVTLGEMRKPGLGQVLYSALDQTVPVIGVAKKRFKGTPLECALLRGASQTPLFVTAAGLSLANAKINISAMHGPYRIPTLLKQVDQLCRSGIA
ncbi:MAG: endonuclease V [Chloroflexota bacterium]